jgi:adenine phosphoribosyltransferase
VRLLKESWHGQPIQETEDYIYIVNPLTDQTPACSPELIQKATEFLSSEGNFEEADKILGEEDRGGILIPHVSTETETPFSLAKWYPSELEGEHSADFRNGYADGFLYVNGIEDGDKVVIVDDLISTGSTLVNLVEVVEKIGAEVIDIVTICEKPQFGGAEKVEEETGIMPKVGFEVIVRDGKSVVPDLENE